MSLGRRSSERQDCFWVAADKLGKGPRNAFYDRLNQLLTEIEFDQKLEKAAEPYYQTTGRKGLPPGVYFRMIFVRLLRGTSPANEALLGGATTVVPWLVSWDMLPAKQRPITARFR